MNPRTLIATLFALASFGLTETSWACSCVDLLVSEPEEAYEKSKLVFSGYVLSVETVVLPRVVHIKEGDRYVTSQTMERKGLVTFRVERDWKGESPRTYVILAGAPPEEPLQPGHILVDCQAHFEEGKTYLVFASGTYPEANPCTPTGEVQPGDAFVERLEKYVIKPQRKRKPAN